MTATESQLLSRAYPLGARLNELGRLEIGGCDVVDVAHEFGTPAFVVAEDDLRQRARAFREAFAARHSDFDVLFASKSFPVTAVERIFAEEGLGCDVASGGELAVALKAGFEPERIYVHGNAKSERELREAVAAGAGRIVVDGLGEIDRLGAIVADLGVTQRVLLRVRPGVKPSTHDFISTGQVDSKFGVSLGNAPRAIDRIRATQGLELMGLHVHIGSQIFELGSFRAAIEAIAALGSFPEYDLGGGLGVAYTAADDPPSIESYVDTKVRAAQELLGSDVRLVIEPGRSLVANSTVTLYTVETVKRGLSTYVGVDGGMSDNLRPMLYGAVYEAQVADRFGGGELCQLVGKHCESSDVIVRDADLAEPRVGDVIVVPATGAYGFAMASNYNGVPRPPVIFCRDGDARAVVRRETYEDLTARDV